MKRMISAKVLPPRLPELGKVKIGGKGAERTTAAGKKMRLPVKYENFVVTTRERGEDENFVRDTEIHRRIGEKPTELDVRVPFDEPEDNFFSELCVYSGRTKVWACDGEQAQNLKTGQEGPCARATGAECHCKPYGRLTMILEGAPTLGGVYTFRSTSWESVRNIQSSLLFLHEHFGTLRGLPLRLVLYPATDQYQQGSELRESTSYKVGLVLRCSLQEAAEAVVAQVQHQQMARSQIKLLAAATEARLAETDDLEAAEIATEYFPDPNDISSVATQERIDALKETIGIAEVVEPEEEQEELLPLVCGNCGERRTVPGAGVESGVACPSCGHTMIVENGEDPVGDPASVGTYTIDPADDETIEVEAEVEEEAVAVRSTGRVHHREGELQALHRLFWLRWHENCPIPNPDDKGDRQLWQLKVTGKASQQNWKEEHYQKAIAALEEHPRRVEVTEPDEDKGQKPLPF